jgi:hypothetical protein
MQELLSFLDGKVNLQYESEAVPATAAPEVSVVPKFCDNGNPVKAFCLMRPYTSLQV